jgi:branched-chain amino acid transport system substrate-binding protein
MIRGIPRLRSALAAVALAAAPLATAHAAEPFTIYGILSLTGSGAFLGKQEQQSLNAYAKMINEKGGIDGRPIRFEISDDSSSPSTAVQLANSIIAKNVPLMVGPTLVASCKAVAPLVANGPVEYCFAPGVYPPPGSYAFASMVSTKDLVIASLRYFRARGWTKLAILSSSDASGQDGETVIDEALAMPENKGVSVVAREHFNITDISMTAQMAHIRASGAQAMIAWTTGTPFGTVLRSSINTGVNIPLLTNSGNISDAQMKQYEKFSPKQLYFATVRYLAYEAEPPGPVKDAQKQFFTAMKAAGISPDTGPAIAWDAATVVTDTLRHVGLEASASKVHDYIENLHGLDGINGTFDFRGGRQRGLSLNSAIIVKWDTGRNAFVPVSQPGGLPLKGH